jgi:hypothetical protein
VSTGASICLANHLADTRSRSDLSWGATRQVAGKAGAPVREDKTAIFDGTSIPLRKWSDWERSRLRKLRRVAKRRERAEELERRHRDQFNGPPGSRNMLFVDRDDRSETSSLSDDVWGSDVGGVGLTIQTTLKLDVDPSCCSTTRRPPNISHHPRSCWLMRSRRLRAKLWV